MSNAKRFFFGICDSCNETYEAQAKGEDLKGVRFKCRRDFCSGKVTLDETRAESLKFLRNVSSDKTAHRVC
jgi:hypothetical protein